MAQSKAQLVAEMQALQAKIEAAGAKESEVRQEATEATKQASDAKEAKGYAQNIETLRQMDGILRDPDPIARFEAAIKAGKIKPLNKSSLDVRVDGKGGVDAVAKKYSARSVSATTSTSGTSTSSFKVSTAPVGISFTNGTLETGEANVIRAVAKIYSIDVAARSWSEKLTIKKWTALVTEYCSKQGVEKTHAAMGSTIGAMIAFADPSRPQILLTEWLKVQLDVFNATQI